MASLSDLQIVTLTSGADNVAGGGPGAPGAGGRAVIHADLGDDTVSGGLADETIIGGSGNDQLDGGAGDDVLYGGDGNDFLVYDFDAGGSDRLFGGAGRDTLVLEFSSAYFTANRQAEIAAYLALLSAGQDPGQGGEFAFQTFGLRVTSIENLLLFVDGAPRDPNLPPGGVALPDSFSVSEDAETFAGDVGLNDILAPGAVFSLVDFDDDAGALDFRADGSFDFTPGAQFQSLAAGETATVSFTYRLTTSLSDSLATATITIVGANDAPTANNVAVTTDEDTPIVINLVSASGASDPDASDTLVLNRLAGFALDMQSRLLPLPSGAEAEAAQGGVVTFDPRGAFDFLNPGETAEEAVEFVVSDGNGGLVTRTLTVTITGLNDAPVAVDDFVSATEGGFVEVDLLANDFDPDANGVVSLVGFDDEGSAGGVLFEDEESGELVFDANGEFEDLGAGETRATTFSYEIVDGTGARATATLTVTVTGENDAPTAGFLSDALTENETLTGNLIVDGGVTDIDASDVLTIVAVNGAPLIGSGGVFTLLTGATLTVSADGGFTYDPRAAFDALGPQTVSGDSFTVTVSDGNGGQAEVFASLTISGLNDAPVAVNDSAATDQDSFVDINILANDSDPDSGDSIALEAFDQAGSAGGVLFANEGGGLTFNPAGDFDDLGAGETRATTFSYTISDEFGAEATATITVTVTGLNDAPQGGFISGSLTEDETLTGNLILDGGATDADATDVLTIIEVDGAPLVGGAGVFTLSTGATLTVSADGGFTYDPRAAFDSLTSQGVSGEFFTVTVSDGNGGQAEVLASLTILGVNDAPVAVADSIAGFSDRETIFDPLDNDFDVDGPFDLLDFDIDGSAGGTLGNLEGSLRFDPGQDFLDLAPGATRTTTFTYTIEDDAGAEATATITVTVTGVAVGNSSPEGGSFILEIGEDDFVEDDLFSLSGAFDPDPGDAIRVTAVDGAPVDQGPFFLDSGLFLTVGEDGFFTLDAAGAFDFLREGERISDEFIVTISDNSGEEALITATIDIIGVNDAPELAPLDFTFSQNDVSGLLGLLDGAFDAEGDPLSISFFSQIEGPNVFGDFGPAAVRYDGFASFAGLEPTPIGDLNGDGFQDFFLGAGYSSGTEGIYLQGGRVILGGAANRVNADLADGTFDGVVDLALANLPGVLAVEPEQGTYALGFEVAGAGDLNGDGIDDFLVSDPSFSDGGGAVHVVFGGAGGGAAFGPAFSPSRLDGANGFTIFGEGGAGGLGRTLSTQRLGDIDGDGVADFLVAAPEASPGGETRAGSVFIVSGAGLVQAADGSDGLGIADAVAAGGLRLNGTQGSEYLYEGSFTPAGYLGGALAAGDVDGDGVADILIGVRGEIAASGFGVTYLIFGDDPAALEAALGGSGGAATLTQASVAAAGGFAFENAGSSLAVIGDVNGDGFSDLFIGVHFTDGSAESYIVFGGRDSLSALDAQDGAADGRINLDRVQGEYGFVLSDLAAYGGPGSAVTAPGDVDGDGLADLLISGYPSYDYGTSDYVGRVFLLFGGQLEALDGASVQDGAISLDEVDGTTGYVFEARGDTSFGFTVASGDFDGDGSADLLISDSRFRNEAGLRVGTTYLISDAGEKLAALDALDGSLDGRIDANLLSGLFIDTGEPPAGAFTPLLDDAEFDPSLFAYLGAGEQETVAIEYGVSDGTAETVNTVTITITGENDAPFGFGVSFETDEDTLSAPNIISASEAFDPDANDVLTVIEFDGIPLAGGTESFSFDEDASLSVSADGTVVIDGDFDFLRAGEALQFSFSFTVSDLAGETFTDNYSFTITGVNDAPVANDDAAATDQGSTVDVFVLENDFDLDLDDDPTIVALETAGSAGGVLTERDLGGHVFNPNGAFDDLAAGETRETTFSYTIRDEAGAEATATLTVTITGLNDAPTGGDASFSTDEDTDLAGDFLAASGAADVDNGDALRLTAINGQALTAGQVSVTFGSGAVLTANEDGTFSLSVAGNYESLAQGESASEAFSFTVADAAGASFTASATISITGVNDAPVASSDAVETDEDTAIEIDLLANDSDIDDGTLTLGLPDTTGEFGFADIVLDYNGAGDPSQALGSGDGVFVSLPTGTSLTVAFIDEVIFDGAGADLFIGEIGPGGERANIEVSADGVNFIFIGVADNNTTTAFDLASIGFTQQLVAVRITGLDSGGSSPGFDVDFVQAVGVDVEGTRGNLTDLGGGVVNYDPSGALDFLREGETFIDLFTYSVTDAFGAASVAVVEVTVTGVNDAPTGSDASFSTDEDTDLSGDLLAASAATDLDDGDILRLTAINGQALTAGQVSVTFGSGAVLTANEDGTFSLSVTGNYEALNDGESASEAFSFTVADDFGGSFTASATIRIDGVTDGSLAPVAIDDSATVNEESQITVAVLNNDDAPGGGPLTTSLVTGQTFIGAVTVLANQSIQFNPAGAYDFLGVGESATETIRYLATDSSNGLSDEGLFTVTITGVNDRPTGGSITDQTDEDTALTGNVIADSGAADRDANDVLRVLDVIIGGVRTSVTGTQSFTTAAGATLTISEDGTYEYSPVGAFDALAAGETSAPDAFSVTLDDQSGAGLTTATVTLSISVTGVNDAPEVTAIDLSVSELDDALTIDLFEFATDAENQTLTISDFRQVSGAPSIGQGDGLAGMRFEGPYDYGYAGGGIALGDVNGDGVSDFGLVTTTSYGGGADFGYIVFGGTERLRAIDEEDGVRESVANMANADTSTEGVVVISAATRSGSLNGGDLGDINGDGFDDILIGDGYAGPNEGGRVHVLFGGQDNINRLSPVIDLSATPQNSGFTLSLGAGAAGDEFGGYLPEGRVGDVDGDGVADLLIGSNRVAPNDAIAHFVSGGALAGAADASGNVDVNDLVRAADGSAYRFVGGAGLSGEGHELRAVGVATGDIDGDGVNDFLISASTYDYYYGDPGETYVVFGGGDALAAADAADGSANGSISLDTIGAAGGFTLVGAAFQPAVIGDVNGDGITDFAVVDRYYGGENGFSAFVIFGGRDNLAGLDDADGVRDGRLDPFRAAEEGFGLAFEGLSAGEGGLDAELVALGDVDGDGLDDFAIANGSNRIEGVYDYTGEVHIILSSARAEADAADGSEDGVADVDRFFTVRATPSTTTGSRGETFADAISSADVNGDGFLDLLIEERRFFDGARFAAGAVHILFGGGTQRLDALDSEGDQVIEIAEALNQVTPVGVPPAGALVFDDPVSFNPSAFDFLEAGEEEVLVFEFTVSDGQAETVNTLTITVTGEEPAVGGGFSQFLSNASKPMIADEPVFGLEEATVAEIPAPVNATFTGSAGSNRIEGTEEDDVVNAGDGNDRVIGDKGNDLIRGEGGRDELRGGLGDDTIFGGSGDDTIFGQGGDDSITGGRGEDVLNGGRDDDFLSGNRNDDTLIGGQGFDTLLGGRGNDLMNGGGNADVLNGGRGADTLIGSFGVDTFVFERGFGNDRIQDFRLFETLDFSGHDGVSGLGDLTLSMRGNDALIEDGLGGRLVLAGVDIADLDAGNFLF